MSPRDYFVGAEQELMHYAEQFTAYRSNDFLKAGFSVYPEILHNRTIGFRVPLSNDIHIICEFLTEQHDPTYREPVKIIPCLNLGFYVKDKDTPYKEIVSKHYIQTNRGKVALPCTHSFIREENDLSTGKAEAVLNGRHIEDILHELEAISQKLEQHVIERDRQMYLNFN